MHRLLCLLLWLPHLAQAGEKTLSLGEAEALWRTYAHELRRAEGEVQGAAADVLTAAQRPNPTVALNVASISPGSGYGAGGWMDKKMDSILRFEQTIERGGKRELRVRGAEARLAAARFDLDETLRQQRAVFQRAYHDLHLAQDKARLASEAAELYGKTLAAAELRLRAGDMAPVEVARLGVDKARADNEARQAQAEREAAEAVLRYLTGLSAPEDTLVAGDDWPSADEILPGLPATEARPALKAAARRVEAAEAERDLARALRSRDVGVGMQVERNLQNAPTNSFGLGVSIPLFVWHAHEGEIARAEADFNSARLQMEQQKAAAGSEVMVLQSAVLAARDRLRRLEGGLLADAEKVAAAADLAYRKGAMGVMDLLDARRTLRQVQIEAAAARADYAKARADWLALADSGKQP